MAKKSASDMKDSHFSKYGEFLVSYELSRQGWNVYGPVYDEYVDFVVSGFVCSECRHILRTVTPQLRCPCGETISNAEKRKCISVAICSKCGTALQGAQETGARCRKCNHGTAGRERFLACFGKDGCKYTDPRDMRVSPHSAICEKCESESIHMVFRTVQVKSSRKEDGGTYAVDHKLRDLVPDMNKPDARHFFVWCAVDDDNPPTFFVMSAGEFADAMGDKLYLPSFLKDDGREHFKLDADPWVEHEGKFEKMRRPLEGDPDSTPKR